MLKKSLMIVLLIMCTNIYCAKPGSADFVTLVHNHKELTIETNNSIIASIEEEMQKQILSDPSTIDGLEKLLSRLKMISKQSSLIDQYITINVVDKQLLAEILTNQWNKKNK